MVGPGSRVPDRGRVAQIGLDGVDLADDAHGLQMAGEIGAADRGADAPAALRERADHVAADEARAAEHRDETTVSGPHVHG